MKIFKDRVLGRGSYGTVYEGQDSKGHAIAVKEFKVDTHGEGIDVGVLREIAFLKSLPPHPNIIQIIEINLSKSNSRLQIGIPLCERDLSDYFKNIRQKRGLHSGKQEIEQLMTFIKQLFLGVQHLHYSGVFHRDLKPSNILIAPEGNGINLVICDFSLASTFVTKIDHSDHIQTLWYRAPEILLGSTKYNELVDIWSLGAIICFMVKGDDIMRGDSEFGQIMQTFMFRGSPSHESWKSVTSLPYFNIMWPKFKTKKIQDALPEISRTSSTIIDIAELSLSCDPSKRISASAALKMLDQ